MEDRKNASGVFRPHDKGYKKSLSDPRQFLHFLQKYIGADWMLELKDSQLSLCDKEMLEKDYEGREADLIYRALRPDGKEIYIFILQELQSTVDYTMIFRILIYVVNTLLKHFLETDKKKRESAGFRLPAMVPIVFYNGEERWTAADNMRIYQNGGEMFGDYILNLKYYLVDLASVEEEYILSTNTVIDNILYCDKFRRKQELAGVIRTACRRVQELGAQEVESFRGWVKYILLSVCENREDVVQEILNWAANGEGDMAFQYNIIVAFERERAEARAEGRAEGMAEGKAEGKAEGRAEGKAEDILDFLEEKGRVPEELRVKIMEQSDLDILKKWLKLAVRAESVGEFERQMRN